MSSFCSGGRNLSRLSFFCSCLVSFEYGRDKLTSFLVTPLVILAIFEVRYPS
jgi:hypothetical protein